VLQNTTFNALRHRLGECARLAVHHYVEIGRCSAQYCVANATSYEVTGDALLTGRFENDRGLRSLVKTTQPVVL